MTRARRRRPRRHRLTVTFNITREPCPSGGLERWRMWQGGRSLSDLVRYRADRAGD